MSDDLFSSLRPDIAGCVDAFDDLEVSTQRKGRYHTVRVFTGINSQSAFCTITEADFDIGGFESWFDAEVAAAEIALKRMIANS